MVTLDSKKIKGENLNGSYSELASFLGVETVLKIHSKYRGTQMFFPVELFSRDFIREQIVNEYNGSNIRELAIKYGYTEKWIRKIVKEKKDNDLKGG
ncbi:MAG: Mor transcription activator family protein [Clostridia bacterium]|nr:Mor transcription activator family protein [Clostridia bacterium]